MDEKELIKIEEEYEESFTMEQQEQLRMKLRDYRLNKLLNDPHLKSKNTRVNIRIAEYDLNSIKKKAQDNNMPYQTLMRLILSKYARGNLKVEL